MTRDEVIACLTFPGQSTQSMIELRNKVYLDLLKEHDSISKIEELINAGFDLYSLSQYRGAGGAINPKDVRRILSFTADDMVFNKENHDTAMRLIAYGGIKAYVSFDQSRSLDVYPSFARWINGDLKGLSILRRFLSNNDRCKAAAICTLANNDFDGMNHLLKVKRFEEFSKSRIHIWMQKYPPKDDRFYDLLGKSSSPKYSSFQYIEKIRSLSANNFGNKVDSEYDPARSKKLGHEIIYAIGNSKNLTTINLAERITRDGGDWYMGHKQLELGHAVYLDLIDRDIDCVAELSEILDTFSVETSKSQTSVITGIIRGLPKELSLACARLGQQYADKLFLLRGDRELMPLVTSELIGQKLEDDLGL